MGALFYLVLMAFLAPAWLGLGLGVDRPGSSSETLLGLALFCVSMLGLRHALRGSQYRVVGALIGPVFISLLSILGSVFVLTHLGIETSPASLDVSAGLVVALVLSLALLGAMEVGAPIGFGKALTRHATGHTRALLICSALDAIALTVYVMAAPGQAEQSSRDAALPIPIMVSLMFALGFVPVSIGAFIGYGLSHLLASLIVPGIAALSSSARYFKPLIWPSVGFAIGYLSIAIVFAGYYLALGHASLTLPESEHAFRPQTDGATVTDVDILYFSLMTMLALDNGKIAAASPGTKWLVAAHGLVTTGWNLLYFAAVTAYVARFWTQLDDEPLEDVPDAVAELQGRVSHLEAILAEERAGSARRHAELLTAIRDAQPTPSTSAASQRSS
jgi:hypothetical protein